MTRWAVKRMDPGGVDAVLGNVKACLKLAADRFHVARQAIAVPLVAPVPLIRPILISTPLHQVTNLVHRAKSLAWMFDF